MIHDLSGRVIAISGAGTGIGRATALACADAGMPVSLAGRREAPLLEVQSRILAAGGRAMVAVTDVSDAAQTGEFVERTVRELGPLYAVFANAGYGLRGAVHELSDQAIREVFETNFWGSMNLIRPALAHMLRRGEGHVLMCSSCLSKLGTPYTAPYSASKAMQDHFGRAMRIELAPLGIHVSTIHPIGTRTEFVEAANRVSGGPSRSLPARGILIQPPERVARAVVACLRRPRGEVWTSGLAKRLFGLANALPGLTDFLLRRAYRDPQKHGRNDPGSSG